MKNFLTFGFTLLAAGLAAAQPARIARDLKTNDSSANLDGIVQLKLPAGSIHQIQPRLRNNGGVLQHEMGFIQGGTYSLPVSRPASSAGIVVAAAAGQDAYLASVAWGTLAFLIGDSSGVWETSATWGDFTARGFSAGWGDSAVVRDLSAPLVTAVS